jgi:acyl transferase domain-containing protein/acyl carrier protein
VDKPVPDVVEALRRSLLENERLRARNERLAATAAEPIAVVAMSCRYPGGVESPEDLWQLVADGVDAVGDFPADRGWDTGRLFDADPDARGHSYSRAGGFLTEAGAFDARLFGISPREALTMDPQQRLLLHAAWESFERAGIPPLSLEGAGVGVFVGGASGDHPSVLAGAGPSVEGEILTGSAGSVLSGRIAYAYGLNGPAVTVDTACSSSLVALHLAVRALRGGECDLALAGGVAVMHTPSAFIEISRQRGLAADGRCKAFAAAADGTGFAEGVGLILLERLSDAQRRGRRILAVVRGSAVGSDGASNGLSAPSGAAQRKVIRAALADARLTPADVDAVEAHGTGTRLGDPIEADAVVAAYGRDRPAGRPLWLGSIKSNVGHTQAAAGVAGVIKLVQALRHGVLPKTLHVDEPTPHVDWSAGAVRLLTEPRPWPETGRPRRGAVSSFGVSGTNAHLILEAAPEPAPVPDGPGPAAGVLPFLVSGKTGEALRDQAAQLRAHLEQRQDLADVARSLVTTRSHLDHRAVVVAGDRAELARALAELTPAAAAQHTDSGVVFVFPGQGWQWRGMAGELLATEPVFAARFAECAAVLDPALGWSITEALRETGGAPSLQRIDVVQPVLFAVMVALAEVWKSYGVEPAGVIGHSQGEIAAACVAGALSLADAATVVIRRSAVFARELVGRGLLASVALPPAEVEDRLRREHPGVTVAAVNGPRATIVAGPDAELEALIAACAADGVRARIVPGTVASHCAQVEPLRAELTELLAGVTGRAAGTEFFSSVTGGRLDPAELGTAYWYRNAREPVAFDRAVRAALARGHRVFVEVSGHPVLAPGVEQIADEQDVSVVATGTLRKDEGSRRRLLTSLAVLHNAGVGVDWSPAVAGARVVDLPTYAFDRTRYWLETSAAAAGDPGALGLTALDHPLVGAAVTLATSETTVVTGMLSLHTQPWLADHALGDTALLPATAFVELALRTGARHGCDRLDELTLREPLILPPDGGVRLQLVLDAPDGHGRRALTVHSQLPGGGEWIRHADAVLTPAVATEPVATTEKWPPAGAEPVPEAALDELYETLAAMGMAYGPAFQGLTAAWRLGEDVLAEVRAAEDLRDTERFGLHPALLDAALHASAFGGFTPGGGPLMPFAWTGVTLHRTGASALRVRLSPAPGGAIALRATDEEGRAVLSAESVVLRPAADTASTDGLWQLGWNPLDAVADTAAWTWLDDFADFGDTEPAFVVTEVRHTGAEPEAVHAAVQETAALVRRWLAEDRFARSQLVLLTRDATTTDAAGAAVWGFVRSAQSEHPGRFVLVDRDTEHTDWLAAALATGEPQLARREDALFVPRLARIPATDPRVPAGWDSGGPVVLTGATGTLGGPLARHLVTSHGVRRLVLVSRRGAAAPGAEDLRAELAALGADVTLAACDAADPGALAALLDGLEPAAVVHAAVVLDDGVVSALTPDRIAPVLRAKVDAAWHLHRLTRDTATPLVLFSSAAGLLGTPGQAAYAAANAYLDALAARRRAEGLPAQSLAWGRWSREDGLTAGLTEADAERMTRAGVLGMTVPEGLSLFDTAVTLDRAVVVPARIDTAAVRAADEVPPLLRGLARRSRDRRRGAEAPLHRRLAGLGAAEQERLLLDLVTADTAAVLGYAGQVDPLGAFAELGFTSLTAVEFRNRLATTTGLRLPATLVFDQPNPRALAAHLRELVVGVPEPTETPAAAPVAADPGEPIAVVAMSCRYPGGVDSPDELWRLVAEGGDALGPFPVDRGWDSLLGTAGGSRTGGFLPGAADFDPALFGISPREAVAMDPQQRLLLEAAWEAFERAGIDPASVRGSRTGVFAGVMYHDYGNQVREIPEEVAGFLSTGTSGSVVSGRVSYTFGLVGPALTIDTACSSSLVAVHTAVRSLRSGETSMALAGGVTVMATPATFADFARQGGLAADGRSKSFAAAADGTSLSEGAGLLLLERLSDARRHGHPVLAVLRGSAVNSDGASNGLTAPNGTSQQRVIRQALSDAGLTTGDVDLVEAHGTGTALGDPIEAQAVLATYGQDRERPVWLGSLKSNLGHAQAASGVAGIIKVVEAIRRGVVPATLHVDEPSPHVDWSAGAVRLATAAVEWPDTGRPRRAGVSSFGVSGTNAHVVVEQAPESAAPVPAGHAGTPLAFLVSGKTAEALRAQAGALLDVEAGLPDLAWSLATSRAVLEHRAVVVAGGRDALLSGLDGVARDVSAAGAVVGRAVPGKVAFVFPGQGAQWAGMGRELLAGSAVFAARMAECAAALDPLTGWSLLDVVENGELDRVDVVQPVSFAVMVSLAAVWQAAGVTPDVLVGHSQGEIAAACVAGALSLADAARVVVVRSRVIADRLSGHGGMVSLPLPADRVRELIAPFGARVCLAALNGPRSTVVSGDPAALDEIVAGTERARRVEVDYASHSAQVDAVAAELAEALAGITPVAGRVPVFSTVRAELLDGTAFDAGYWVENLRRPVRFHGVLDELLTRGHRFVVEVSPHPVLTPAVRQVIDAHERDAVALGTLRRGEPESARLLASLAELHVHGGTVDWRAVLPEAATVPLPTYRFQRSRYWLEPTPAGTPVHGGAAATADSWRYRIGWSPFRASGTPAGTWLQVVSGDEPRLLAAATVLAVAEADLLDRAALAARLAAHTGVAGVLTSPTSSAAALVLAQALGDAGVEAPLWIVTRGALTVADGEAAPDPVQAELWGLGPVIGLEHPRRWGGLVDLPAGPDERASARLAAVLAGGHGEDQVAVRPQGLFARRLVPAATGAAAEPAWRTSGTTLITGGTGNLGVLTARWAIARGATRVVLLSRGGAPAGVAAGLRELGAEVEVVACDVTDRAALTAAVELADTAADPLRVVVHAAASLEVAALSATSAAGYTAMMRAKVAGADLLHELTGHRELDAFVLYSSVAGVWGSGAHAAYSSANAHLDALAAKRRAHGLPALCVAWGVWSTPDVWDSGNVVEGLVIGDRQTRHGLPPMDPATAFAGLHTALDRGETSIVVADVDWSAFVPLFTLGRPSPLLETVPAVRQLRTAAPAADRTVPSALRDRLTAVPAAERVPVVLDLVRTEVAAVLGQTAISAVEADRAFGDLGFTSLTAVELRDKLTRATGVPLPATLIYDHPTAEAVARHLLAEVLGEQNPAGDRPVAAAADDPIAIVGMACRYPGGVGSPADLWSLVADGVDAVGPFPADRGWDLDGLFHPDPDHPGTSYARHAGFLRDAAGFDAAFFGISPREARAMDPQQRLLLEIAWEALERGGIAPTSLRGSRTGVFIGANPAPQTGGAAEDLDGLDGLAMTGTLPSVLSGRVCYALGLEGPAVTVDTACSSSLVALHLAAQSLRTGESTLALAGGVMVMTSPAGFVGFSRQRGLAADGRCKAFSADADGMGFAEGAGLLLLERLSDAQRHGHPVLAVVRGSAVNSDGASNGLTAPNGPAQQRVIRQALSSAGLSPSDVDVVEAHGTGTTLGDPIEAQAVLATYGQERDRPVLLGSVKSNLGHAQAASGVAGVIKVVEALRRGVVPATLHAGEPSPHVDWSAGAVELATSARPWPDTGRPRRAGVSSFGLSGTNAHVIVEQAPPAQVPAPTPHDGGPLPFVVSARSPEALRAQAAALLDVEAGLPDLAWSLAANRALLEHRAVVVADGRDALLSGLDGVARGVSTAGTVVGRAVPGKVAFVFPGQGAQWAGMGRELLIESEVFAARMAECAAVLDPLTGWSLLDVVKDGELDRVDVVQPVSFAVMVSLAAVWESFGVSPGVVVGHSQGEVAAACVAGALSLADAARIVVARSRVIARRLAGRGGMLSTAWPAEVAHDVAARFGGRVSVAALNGPAATVLSGDPEALAEIEAECAASGVRARRIDVDYASHSAQVDAVAAEIEEALAGITPRAGRVPLRSTVRGEVLTGAELGPAYWVENLRAPVRFHEAVDALFADGVRFVVEAGPHPVLTPAIEQAAEAAEAPAVVVGTLRRNDGGLARLLASLAEAHVGGLPVDWTTVVTCGTSVELPTYPFQHQRFWPEPAAKAVVTDSADTALWDTVATGDLGGLAAELDLDATVLDGVLPRLLDWRKRRQVASAADSWRYRDSWVPLAGATAVPTGTWAAVVPDRADAWTGQVLDTLRRTAEVVVVPAGSRGELAERFTALDGLSGVVSLLALDERPHGVLRKGLPDALALIAALGDAGVSTPLWTVTRDAVATGPADFATGFEQAPVWGTGRVAALEHPGRWGGLVDLPPVLDEHSTAGFLGVLGGLGDEDQIAVRGTTILGRRLVRATGTTAARTTWRPSGTVLITGGTGALGARVARWAAGHGARHLVLTSRRGPAAPGAAELVAELGASGATAEVVACDVADRAAVAALLAAVPADRPLTAVVHAAGVPATGAIAGLTPEDLAATAAVKVGGARALHELTADLDLAAFVLFSSGAAAWGSAENAAYAAGNTYLDALARHRRAAGLPATSIAWGNWGGGGMTAGAAQEVLTRRGVRAMDPAAAVAALVHAVEHGQAQLTIADVDWARFTPPFTIGRPSPLLTGIPEAVRALQPERSEATGDALRRELAPLPRGEQRRHLTELVRTEVAAVLAYPGAAAVEAGRPFTELGFDSVTAVELRNRLVRATGVALPATLVFDHPTVDALTGTLLAGLGTAEGPSLLDRLDVFGRELADGAAPLSADDRATAVLRLQTLLTRLAPAGVATAPDTLDGTSDEELFGLIDKDLGVS